MARAPSAGDRRTELSEQRRRVDFDTYDLTVDELLRRVGRGRIDIAPVYQRQFRWDLARQSRLVESVFLGIPIPPLFMATNQGEDTQSQWEVVDGLQRLLTLVNFAGDTPTRSAAKLTTAPLRLEGLEKLTTFDKCDLAALPEDIATAFEDRPLKVVVLNDLSDLQVRYDLFERLNTGGVSLTPQEIRECVYRGRFMDLLGELSSSAQFRQLVLLPEGKWKDGTPEDFVLRFFAFCEQYMSFQHSVKDFLNEFAFRATTEPETDRRTSEFFRVFDFLTRCFPSGIRPRTSQTPVNVFEAVSVGAALALRAVPGLQPVVEPAWVTTDDLRRLTSGGTNSRARVAGRIEYCRDQFLRGDA